MENAVNNSNKLYFLKMLKKSVNKLLTNLSRRTNYYKSVEISMKGSDFFLFSSTNVSQGS